MIFGAHFVGVYRIGFLDREARMDAGIGAVLPLGLISLVWPLLLVGPPVSVRN